MLIRNKKGLEFLVWLTQNPDRHLPPRFYHLNWPLVLQLARKNRITSFLNHIASCRRCQKHLPAKEVAKIKMATSQGLYTYFAQEHEKRQLEAIFQQLNITAFLFKDIQAFGLNYPNHLFPGRGDLDFFLPAIAASQLNRLKKRLRREGYRYRPPEEPPSTRLDRWELRYQRRGLLIELHLQNILPYPQTKANPFASEKNRQFTQTFFSPAAREALFLAWAAHFFFRDSLRSLRTLYDLGQICQRGNLNWPQLFRLAKRFDFYHQLIFIFAITQQTYSLSCPPAVRLAIESDTRLSLARQLYSPLITALGKIEPGDTAPKVIDHYIFLLQLWLADQPFWHKIGPRALSYALWDLPRMLWTLKNNQPYHSPANIIASLKRNKRNARPDKRRRA